MVLMVKLEGDGAWPDLAGRDVIYLGNDAPPIQVTGLKGGTRRGAPSVALRLDLPDGRVVIAETSLKLFGVAADALRAHFGKAAAPGIQVPTPEVEADVDLGPCCACGGTGLHVRNVLRLHPKAPTPGRGWGCLQCGLPADGAIAVVCDDCLEAKAKLQAACRGYPGVDGRVPIAALTGEQRHYLAKHPVVWGRDE
jgi:hypothetical protein